MKNAVLLFTGFFIISAVYAQTKPDALAEYRRNNFEQAVLICRDEIALDSRNLDSYVVMCWSLLRLNRYEETLRYALIARDINRYDARVV
ncbi:MAG: hypothetical protein FWH41_08170, partial [Treponema sp.]|nr:hypothetical protein [Treponema sp.]